MFMTFPLQQPAWHLLVPEKVVFREEAFRSVPAQGPLGLVSEVHGVFSNRALPIALEGKQEKWQVYSGVAVGETIICI